MITTTGRGGYAATATRPGGLRDAGSATLEYAVFVLPMCVLAVLLVMACFRVAAARLDLAGSAAAAARAASLARSPQAAITAATQTAQDNLAGHHLTCTPMTVSVDTSSFRPGGLVSVTVTCTTQTRDLLGARLPGQLTGSATAHAVIDAWRDLDTP